MNENQFFYTLLPKPIPIFEQEWPEGTLPLVYTRTMAYNHEVYIRQCIEGILTQETTFPVWILIHDDASIDGTADIIREFQDKYPKTIKSFIQKENTYCKSRKEMKKMRSSFHDLRIGKYEAVCEGDDIWTDPQKLEKQVNFLENNPDYSGIGSNYGIINSTGEIIKESSRRPEKGSNRIIGDIYTSEKLPKTLTTVYRNKYKDIDKIKTRVSGLSGDEFVYYFMLQFGNVAYLDHVTGYYRVHSDGIYSSLNTQKQFSQTYSTLKSLYQLQLTSPVRSKLADKINCFANRIFALDIIRFRFISAYRFYSNNEFTLNFREMAKSIYLYCKRL